MGRQITFGKISGRHDHAQTPAWRRCISPENQIPVDNPQPSHIFYSFGFHPIYNQYGNHWVVNNQFSPQEGWYTDLTPIHSINFREHYL
ncbi:hypothetical protein [Streptomyces aurantiogriseus]|uniref:Uncharacterized protein n=1 Tax=Streptomyces aurantiogriseus TaxID=66870 RepID=A0A918L0C3_9ACTN|nr:hypothetical protein [Streptomyces aurantiogriseus]GGR64396.1 hypothetical protein GCM10010251_96240 [Streptomyces aurantiogriseus]